MADDARLTIELVERGGGSGQAPNPTGTAAQSSVPGSTLAADFQQQLTNQGPAVPGTGSTPAGPSPTISAPVPSLTPTPVSVPSPSPTTPPADPLLTAVRAIVQADPRTTAGEVEAAFGIPSGRAQALLAAAQQNQQQSAPSPTPMPTPLAPRTGPVTIDDIGYEGRLMDQLAEEFGPSDIKGLGQATKMVQAAQASNAQAVDDEAPGFSDPGESGPVPGQKFEYTPKVAGQVQQAVSILAQQAARGGPVSAAVAGTAQTIINQFPALGAALGPMASAAPYLAVGAAALSIPAAAAFALQNEADRAVSLSGNFSPELAQANAEANVRQIIANMRTAETLGDEAAKYVEASSRLSSATQGIRDQLSEPWLQRYNDILEGLASVSEKTSTSSVMLTAASEALSKLVIGLPASIGAAFATPGKPVISPFDWFRTLPHLTPPAPFTKVGNAMDGAFGAFVGENDGVLRITNTAPGLDL